LKKRERERWNKKKGKAPRRKKRTPTNRREGGEGCLARKGERTKKKKKKAWFACQGRGAEGELKAGNKREKGAYMKGAFPTWKKKLLPMKREEKPAFKKKKKPSALKGEDCGGVGYSPSLPKKKKRNYLSGGRKKKLAAWGKRKKKRPVRQKKPLPLQAEKKRYRHRRKHEGKGPPILLLRETWKKEALRSGPAGKNRHPVQKGEPHKKNAEICGKKKGGEKDQVIEKKPCRGKNPKRKKNRKRAHPSQKQNIVRETRMKKRKKRPAGPLRKKNVPPLIKVGEKKNKKAVKEVPLGEGKKNEISPGKRRHSPTEKRRGELRGKIPDEKKKKKGVELCGGGFPCP